jgi:hypothetical protein
MVLVRALSTYQNDIILGWMRFPWTFTKGNFDFDMGGDGRRMVVIGRFMIDVLKVAEAQCHG